MEQYQAYIQIIGEQRELSGEVRDNIGLFSTVHSRSLRGLLIPREKYYSMAPNYIQV